LEAEIESINRQNKVEYIVNYFMSSVNNLVVISVMVIFIQLSYATNRIVWFCMHSSQPGRNATV